MEGAGGTPRHHGLYRVGIGLIGLDPGAPLRIENIGQPVYTGSGVDAALLVPGDGDLVALVGVDIGVHSRGGCEGEEKNRR